MGILVFWLVYRSREMNKFERTVVVVSVFLMAVAAWTYIGILAERSCGG